MKNRKFAVGSWGVLAFNLAVVLWGAYVRASGSGAGCGSHWPLCNGEIIPASGGAARAIEFAHRATSGAALLLVCAMAAWAWRAYPRGSAVRRAAFAAVILMCCEALLGAMLVILKHVAENQSISRAYSMTLHLINTFALIASLTLTAFWASTDAPVRPRKAPVLMLAGALLAVLIVGVSGAVAALGDTLFPSASLAEGLARDVAPGSHLFVRLRLLHPVIAIVASAYLLSAAPVLRRMSPGDVVRRASHAVEALVLVQVAIGLANVAFLAPIPLQLVHLFVADALWISLVLVGAGLCSPSPSSATPLKSANVTG